jgi:hypothetical protein
MVVSQCLWKVICGVVAKSSSSPSLYSCLANGSADEFQRGDQLFRMRAVKDPLQIGKSSDMPGVTSPSITG